MDLDRLVPDKSALLARHEFFRGVSGEVMRKLAAHARLIGYPIGATIFAKGDPGLGLLAVVSGLVRISVPAKGGREVVLRLVGANEVFGEIALLDGGPRTAVATAAYRVGALVIEAPWSRATPGGAKVAGGYMRITNAGTEPDRLVGGSLPAAARFAVHEMSMQGEVMRMRPLETGLEIKPGATVELKPGGYHIMFMDLTEPLKEGQTLKGTLLFEKAGAVTVEYAVRGIAARGEAEHRHAH